MKITEIYASKSDKKASFPYFSSSVAAGSPMTADDHMDDMLDINNLLISHPHATFFVRVEGDSMRDAGISTGDILVVDRAVEAQHGSIVVAIINSEFTVKRLWKGDNRIELLPENPKYSPIQITPEMDFQIWGVVSYTLHKF